MNVTSIEESKRLRNCKIPDRTADYVWIPEDGNYVLRSLENLGMDIEFWKKFENAIPAWSGERLLDLLPEKLVIGPIEYQLIMKKYPNVNGQCTYVIAYQVVVDRSTGERSTWTFISSCTDTIYEGALDVMATLLTRHQESDAIQENIKDLFGEK